MTHREARALRRAAHVLKRLHVGAELGIAPADVPFLEGAGAPKLAPTFDQIKVSLSHAVGAVAVATDVAPVGIDIEVVDRTRDWRRLATRRFAAGEVSQLEQAPDPALAFTRAWCAKEALLKARDLSLRAALALACSTVSETPAPLHGAMVQAWEPAPDVCCALARAL